jgi:hypothetical protein
VEHDIGLCSSGLDRRGHRPFPGGSPDCDTLRARRLTTRRPARPRVDRRHARSLQRSLRRSVQKGPPAACGAAHRPGRKRSGFVQGGRSRWPGQWRTPASASGSRGVCRLSRS